MGLEHVTKLITAAVTVLGTISAAFGFEIPEDTTSAIIAGLVAIAGLIAMYFVPQKPVDQVPKPPQARSHSAVGVVLVFLLALTLSGCATTNTEPAETFNDKVGYSLSIQTAVQDTATRALRFGEITADEAESVADIADDSRALITAARRADAAGDAAGANRKIGIVTNLLLQLQEYLRGDDE